MKRIVINRRIERLERVAEDNVPYIRPAIFASAFYMGTAEAEAEERAFAEAHPDKPLILIRTTWARGYPRPVDLVRVSDTPPHPGTLRLTEASRVPA